MDELIGHPTLAQLLGLCCERRSARRAELVACPRSEACEPLGVAARRVGVRACAARGGDLEPPVDAEVEGAVTDELLGRVAATVAGDVAGRHRHEMRSHAEAVQRLDDANRAEQVHLDRVVDRRVERHRRRGVDDDLARGERLAPRVVEPEPVGAHVTADHCDPARDLLVEAVTEDRSQRVERVVADDLALHALRRGRAPTRADEEHEGAVGHGAQEPLHDCGAEEPGGSGDGDAPAGEGLLDHRHQYLPIGRPSTNW